MSGLSRSRWGRGPGRPTLDRLGWKVRDGWLVTALRNPESGGLNAESHPYILSARDATDLSTLLGKRFDPPGGPSRIVTVVTSTDTVDEVSRDGLSELQAAIFEGCFECHRLTTLLGPQLRLPVNESRATSWLAYHELRQNAVPAIALTSTELQAMESALSWAADTDSTPPAEFWALPIAPQGDPPELFTAGRRLEPSACGQCHEQQSQEWSASRHADAFSPGLWAQLLDAPIGFVEECRSCHTPLRKQIEQAMSLHGEALSLGPAGIDCAGCHVREQRYFSPGKPGSRGRLARKSRCGQGADMSELSYAGWRSPHAWIT